MHSKGYDSYPTETQLCYYLYYTENFELPTMITVSFFKYPNRTFQSNLDYAKIPIVDSRDCEVSQSQQTS